MVRDRVIIAAQKPDRQDAKIESRTESTEREACHRLKYPARKIVHLVSQSQKLKIHLRKNPICLYTPQARATLWNLLFRGQAIRVRRERRREYPKGREETATTDEIPHDQPDPHVSHLFSTFPYVGVRYQWCPWRCHHLAVSSLLEILVCCCTSSLNTPGAKVGMLKTNPVLENSLLQTYATDAAITVADAAFARYAQTPAILPAQYAETSVKKSLWCGEVYYE